MRTSQAVWTYKNCHAVPCLATPCHAVQRRFAPRKSSSKRGVNVRACKRVNHLPRENWRVLANFGDSWRVLAKPRLGDEPQPKKPVLSFARAKYVKSFKTKKLRCGAPRRVPARKFLSHNPFSQKSTATVSRMQRRYQIVGSKPLCSYCPFLSVFIRNPWSKTLAPGAWSFFMSSETSLQPMTGKTKRILESRPVKPHCDGKIAAGRSSAQRGAAGRIFDFVGSPFCGNARASVLPMPRHSAFSFGTGCQKKTKRCKGS